MATDTTPRIGKRRIALRRIALGGLIALSVVIFSVYFREPESGTLHSLQSGAGGMVAPLESIADRAVEPFRDGWSWITDLVDARDRAERLEKEVARLEAQVVESASREERLRRISESTGFPDALATGYRRVPAEIISRSPLNLYGRARLNVGTSDGVVNNSIVVTGNRGKGALVGYIISATSGSSVVSFITDPRTSVGVRVLGSDNAPAVLRASFQGQLEITNLPQDAPLERSAVVETAGFAEAGRQSIYPSGIPVGQVVDFDQIEAESYQRVQVEPFTDPRSLSEVVVLVPASTQARRRGAGEG